MSTTSTTENLLNDVLIQMSRSLLQYVSESSPWVRLEKPGIAEQLEAVAARQRQNVSELVNLLVDREVHVDLGTFPTSYTDLQFIGLSNLLGSIQAGQAAICESLRSAKAAVTSAGDSEALELLSVVLAHEEDVTKAVNEIAASLSKD